MGEEFLVTELRQVRRGDTWLVLVPHAPDAAAGLVAVGMGARDLVVRNDLVVPVNDVERAVGPERDGDGPEPRIVGDEEVGQFLVAITAAFRRGLDELDAAGDGIGEVEQAGALRPLSPGGGQGDVRKRAPLVIRQREAAQAGAAHLRGEDRRRHERLIRAQLLLRAGLVMRARLVRRDGIAEVVRLLHPGLALARDRQAPDVVRSGGEVLEHRAVGREARELGLVEHDLLRAVGERAAVGPHDLRVVEQPLRGENEPAGHARELVREQMRVLRAKTGEDDVVRVGAAVVIRVPVKTDVRAVLHEDAVLPRQDAERHDEVVGKDAGLAGQATRIPIVRGRDSRGLSFRGVNVVIHQHLVAATLGEERVGGRLVLVRIHRILERGHRPHPARRVEGDGHELADALLLGGNQLDLESLRHGERPPLLLRRERARLDAKLRGGLVRWRSGRRRGGRLCALLRRRPGRWRRQFPRRVHAAQRFPRRSAGCGRQFLDGDVLELDQAHAAAVDLHGDLAIERDVLAVLGEVGRRHAVDPDADARALGADAVFVPAVNVHDLVECGLVERLGDDAVAAEFVVDLAEPALAAVDLVAAHVMPAGHAHAADLDAAVDHARGRIAAALDLQLQLEVLVAPLRGDEVVVGNLVRARPAGDHAVLHAPHLRVVIPAGQRPAIEQGDGLGRSDAGSTRHQAPSS
jgi:hypothetical protein